MKTHGPNNRHVRLANGNIRCYHVSKVSPRFDCEGAEQCKVCYRPVEGTWNEAEWETFARRTQRRLLRREQLQRRARDARERRVLP